MKKLVAILVTILVALLVVSCFPEQVKAKEEIAIPTWAWGDWSKSGATFHIDKTNISMGGANLMMPYNLGNANGSLKISQSESMEGTTKVYIITGIDKNKTVVSNTIKLTEAGVLSIYANAAGAITPFDGYTKV